MRRLLLATAAAGGLIAMSAFGAIAAPTAGAIEHAAPAQQHIVQADYYWHHHHYHHRRWSHGGWHYW